MLHSRSSQALPPFSGTSTNSTNLQASPTDASKVGNSFLHCKMNGSVEKLSNNSSKSSISKESASRGTIDKAEHP